MVLIPDYTKSDVYIIYCIDQKEKLDDEKRKLDSFLQLPNLSPEEILEKMGLKGSLDYQRKGTLIFARYFDLNLPITKQQNTWKAPVDYKFSN